MSLGVGIGGLSIGPRFNMVSERTCLAYSLCRRLITPRGSLPWAPNDGMDVREWLNRADTPSHRFSLQAAIKDECEKDERVTSAAVTVVYAFAPASLTITVAIVDAQGPFTLVLGADALTVALLRVT